MSNTQEHDKGKQLSQCTSLGINSRRQETTAERKAKIENNNKDPTKASRMAVTPRYTLTSLHSATAAVIRTTRAQIVQRRTPFQRRIGQWQRPRNIYNNKRQQAQAQHLLQHKIKRTMNSPSKVEEPLVP
jgi:hypothetical protein